MDHCLSSERLVRRALVLVGPQRHVSRQEFLVVGAVALLGIRLRERGSPKSKPVAAPTTRSAPASRPRGCGAAANHPDLGRPGQPRLSNLGDRVGAALVVEGILVLLSGLCHWLRSRHSLLGLIEASDTIRALGVATRLVL